MSKTDSHHHRSLNILMPPAHAVLHLFHQESSSAFKALTYAVCFIGIQLCERKCKLLNIYKLTSYESVFVEHILQKRAVLSTFVSNCVFRQSTAYKVNGKRWVDMNLPGAAQIAVKMRVLGSSKSFNFFKTCTWPGAEWIYKCTKIRRRETGGK